MLKKLLALLLAALMLVSVCTVFSSCGDEDDGYADRDDDDDDDDDKDDSGTKAPSTGGDLTADSSNAGWPSIPSWMDTSSDSNETQAPDTTPDEPKEDIVAIDNSYLDPLPTGLSVTKIGSTNSTSISEGNLGYAYIKNGTAWIASYDGKNNTQTQFTGIKAMDDYFAVTNATSSKLDPTDFNGINCQGLVDIYGKLIIPAEYAYIRIENYRYITVYKVTEELESSEGALYKILSSQSTDGAEHHYAAVWYVYDAISGEKVEDATGKGGPLNVAKGNILSYKTDSGNRVNYCPFGVLDEDATVFNNGAYINGGTVYDYDGTKLFDLNKDGYTPSSVDDMGNYFVARKWSSEGTSYAVMDKTGKIVSAPFSNLIFIRGKLIESKNKVYTFDGKQLINSETKNVNYEYCAGISLYKIETNDKVIILDGALNKLYEAAPDTNINVYLWNGAPTKKEDNSYKVYCYKDRDFTIQGYNVGFLLGYSGSIGSYELKDAITGETLLTGSRNYTAVTAEDGSGQVIVSKTNSGYDFYSLSAK